MGICRDTAGRLAFTMVSNDKKVFSVTREKDPRKNTYIIRHYPYMNTNAGMIDNILLGPAPAFNSFIKAVAFLKANIDNLI